jgi:hypothetical protein
MTYLLLLNDEAGTIDEGIYIINILRSARRFPLVSVGRPIRVSHPHNTVSCVLCIVTTTSYLETHAHYISLCYFNSVSMTKYLPS